MTEKKTKRKNPQEAAVKKAKPEKGSYGYLQYRRKKNMAALGIDIGLGLAVLLLGLLLNKGDIRNVFTVAAVLFVLPGARALTNLIVVWPYHTPSQKDYERLINKMGKKGKLLSDLVFTSKEQVMHLDFLILTGNHAWGYEEVKAKDRPKTGAGASEKAKGADKKRKAAEEYLDRHFANNAFDIKTKVYTDLKELIRAVDASRPKEEVYDMEEVYQSMRYFMV